MPEQEQEMNISSREFLKKAEFVNAESLLSGDGEKTTNGGGSSQGGNTSGNTGGNTGGGNSGGGNSGGGSHEPIGD
jgi:hypothetical protein